MSTRVHVALLLPFTDHSGEPKVLGVYHTATAAQARLWRHGQTAGYDQPTEVVSVELDADVNPDD